MPDESSHLMCMEVWGGSEAISRHIPMGGLDAWVFSRPFGSAASGGDIYYLSSCATGRISRLLIADVAGHGKAIADTAVQLRGLMRRYVNYLDQTQFVRSMNRHFAALSKEECFATALVTTFFAPTGTLSICNAGHPRPMHYRAATGKWSLLSGEEPPPGAAAANLPLGVMQDGEYCQFNVPLETGDLVVCYTDALIEAQDAEGKMLGQEGLLRIFQSLRVTDAATLTNELLEAVGRGREGNLRNDDCTVLLLRPTGKRVALPLKQKLRAAARFVRTAIPGLRAAGEWAPFPDLKLANIGGAMIPKLGRRWRGTRAKLP